MEKLKDYTDVSSSGLKTLLLTRLLDALFGGLPRRLLAGLKVNVGGSSGKK